jgi:hypothetical protein
VKTTRTDRRLALGTCNLRPTNILGKLLLRNTLIL